MQIKLLQKKLTFLVLETVKDHLRPNLMTGLESKFENQDLSLQIAYIIWLWHGQRVGTAMSLQGFLVVQSMKPWQRVKCLLLHQFLKWSWAVQPRDTSKATEVASVASGRRVCWRFILEGVWWAGIGSPGQSSLSLSVSGKSVCSFALWCYTHSCANLALSIKVTFF